MAKKAFTKPSANFPFHQWVSGPNHTTSSMFSLIKLLCFKISNRNSKQHWLQMAAVPAFWSHKRVSQRAFEPFSMQKHVLFRLILIVKYSSVVCLFGCASLYIYCCKNNCFNVKIINFKSCSNLSIPITYILKKQNSRCFFDLSLQLNGFPMKAKAVAYNNQFI
jgi:hypothetical protein